jgi:hypothetical protein
MCDFIQTFVMNKYDAENWWQFNWQGKINKSEKYPYPLPLIHNKLHMAHPGIKVRV